MNMYIAVFLLAGVVSLVGYLWLAIVAFKRSVPWGLLVLLLSPITAIVYSLMHWFEARKAFIVYIISFVLCAGSAVFIYGDVGVGNMQQIAARVHRGELAPAKAYELIAKALAHPGSTDLFAVAPTPADASLVQANTDPASPLPAETAAAQAKEPLASADATGKAKAESAKPPLPKPVTSIPDIPDTVVAADQSAKSDKTNVKPETKGKVEKPEAAKPKKVEKPKAEAKEDKPGAEAKKAKPQPKIPSINQVPPDPLAQKPKKPEPNTVRVRMAKLPHYIGHYFILELKNGSEQRGLLRKVGTYHLILDRKLYGGNFQYKIRKSQVKTIHMLTRLPDER